MMVGNKRASDEKCNYDKRAKKKLACKNLLLFQALQDNDASKCKELLENHKFNVNEKSPDGNTALHKASECNNIEILTILLEHRAEINAQNVSGYTPLHVCSQHNSEEASELLLENGAEVNARNVYQNTPLHLAARHNRLEVCRVLIESGADIDAKGINDCTPLHLAVEHNSIETCQELLSKKANVNVLKKGERTPLHEACTKSVGNKLCRILINYGADINAPNGEGKTPLHICCEIIDKLPQKASKINKAGYRDIIKTLLTYGAYPYNEACQRLYESNPEIKQCLQDAKKLSLLQKWTKSDATRSQKHAHALEKVVKGQNSERINSYEYYNQPIGSGAFGTVHAGVHLKDGREVAIKRMDMPKLPRSEHQREIKTLVQLPRCQNIVSYIDFQEKENWHFVVLELMEGTVEGFLDDPASEGANMTTLCKDVVVALQFLHANNIIHRDIKPNNILYTTATGRVTLKLADFGLSTKIEQETSTVMHTAAGTRCWMASEVIRSLDHSKASDVFASGLVLFYLLVPKQHAFAPEGESAQSSSSQLKTDHEITTNILNNKLNISACKQPEAHHLIKEMLDSDKDHRPSAEELVNHPFFWSEKKKLDYLLATANQEAVCRPKNRSAFELDLEASLGVHFGIKDWSGWSVRMGQICNEMLSSGRRSYRTNSAIHLLRFIRNAYQHASDGSHTEFLKEMIFDEFVFLKEFKFLFMDVYKAVKKHRWDVDCKEIRNVVNN